MTLIIVSLVCAFSFLGFSQIPEIDGDGELITVCTSTKVKPSYPENVAIITCDYKLPTSSNSLFEIASQDVAKLHFPALETAPHLRGPPTFCA
jgi:hypothetical protein